ncbi:MAG: HDIG domain-containing protein [Candidatus Krumholzibacteria bacterium]|nr:HDIG domain-containing protein [Candidatus Krumholzibacteria bacterium]
MLSRDDALELVNRNLTKKNLVKHTLAVEVIMRAIARRFGESEDLWGLAGLLHDLDYERTMNSPELHGRLTIDMLAGLDVPQEVKDAVLAHAGHRERNSLMDKAICCIDPATGLIVASALMHPSKSLAGIDADFVGKRYKEKRFAAGANREAIAGCSELGLDLHEFFSVSIEAMNGISRELELQERGPAGNSSGGTGR